jgi:hypothetical protein
MEMVQIPLKKTTIHVFKNLAPKNGLTMEQFLSERLNQIVAEARAGNIDAAFRKIVQESIETNRELLRKMD